MKQAPYTFVRCGEVSAKDIEVQVSKVPGYRPGGKALFFDPVLPGPNVLLGYLPQGVGFPCRFNLPGGGIDPGEDLATALLREVTEEFGDLGLTLEQVRRSIVVTQGKLPFARDGYIGKYEYLVAMPFVGLQKLVPLADSKIELFSPMSWRQAAEQVWQDAQVHLDQRTLYHRGISAVPQAALLL